MWFLAILAFVPAALALDCPTNCSCGMSDELEYFCKSGDRKVSFNARTNEYVNIECHGNLTCADFPQINFAHNQTLPSLWLKQCSPSIIPCLNHALVTPSVTFLSLTRLQAGLAADDVQHLGDVQEIMITAGPQDPIPPSVLQTMPSLRRLRITSTPMTLTPSTFSQAPGLEFLELSDAQITALPPGVFAGLQRLRILNFWGNNLNEVEVDSLQGLDSLENLSLSTSRVSMISPGALRHVPKLKSLYIMKNQIKEIAPGLIHNLTQLENVTIHLNDVKLQLHPRSISNLPSLKNLIIKDCYADLPKDLIMDCDNLMTLDLSQNRITAIPENFFKDMRNLEYLDLSFNRISKLNPGVFASLKKLRSLNMDRNYLEVLPELLFSGLRQLTEVTFNHNLLTTIEPLAFQGATSLQSIALSGNKLTLKTKEQELLASLFIDIYSPFNTLTQLKKLELSHNNISTVFDDWKIVLVNLEVLDLSWNRFETLDLTNYQFLSNRVTVNLEHNNISTIELYPPGPVFGDSGPLPSNNTILVDNNPFNCDCHMYQLAKRLEKPKTVPGEPNIVIGNAQCKSPPHLSEKLFKNVSPYHLNCEEPSLEISLNCTSVLVRPGYNDLAYDCDYMPTLIPNPEEYGVQNVSMKLTNPPKDISNITLNILNLTSIELQYIPFKPSESVKIIDLSNNNLTDIPIRFLESNTTLYLSNNPFICDCDSKDHVLTLRGSLNVADLDRIICSTGELITELDITALCYTRTLIAEIGGIFIVLLILFVLAFIFSRQIFGYLGHRIFPCWYIDDPDTAVKDYDIFLSYAHKDQKYVNKLLPKLELEFKLKVCVHYRDWEVGDFIPDQINRSVSNSRKTIILLSNSFLDSTFANLEFRTAHNLALKEGRERVILILLEDVSKNEKLSEELKYHMKMNTYLTWDDPRFDEKLRRRTVPQKYSNKKFVRPAILKPLFRQAAENNLKKALDVHLNSAGQLVNLAQNKKDVDIV